MPKKIFGYSLVESLVTLFIVAVITTLSLANYKTGQNSAKLRQTTAEIVDTLRDAQQHALSATCPAPCAIKPSGYVVYYDEEDIHYYIFADQDADGLFDGGDGEKLFVDPAEQRPLDLHVKLAGVDSYCSSLNNASIAFIPPLPQTIIRTKDSVNTTHDCPGACIFNSLAGQTWRVKVDQASGLIESSLWPFGDTTCT